MERNLKRKNDSIHEIEIKRKKTECECRLLRFPDDILLHILSSLPHNSFLALSKTCTRFQRVCTDFTLWKNVLFTEPTSAEDLNFALQNVGPKTKSFDTMGHFFGTAKNDSKDVLPLSNWIFELRQNCPHLNSLSLKHHYIDCKNFNMPSYPRSLVKLDLSNTCLKSEPCGGSYFRYISRYMRHLQVLILSNCHWFDPHSLMALSKCRKLQVLKLDGCQKVDNFVVYCGVATKCGFKALRSLDLRRCPIGDSELLCLKSVTTITELYLQNPVVDGEEQPTLDLSILNLFTKRCARIRAYAPPGNVPPLNIERLVIQNYCLGDWSFINLARDASHLKYLDITCSTVPQEAVNTFVELRPEVQFIR